MVLTAFFLMGVHLHIWSKMDIENQINRLSSVTEFMNFLKDNPLDTLNEKQLLHFMRQSISASGDGKLLPFADLARDVINRKSQAILDENNRNAELNFLKESQEISKRNLESASAATSAAWATAILAIFSLIWQMFGPKR